MTETEANDIIAFAVRHFGLKALGEEFANPTETGKAMVEQVRTKLVRLEISGEQAKLAVASVATEGLKYERALTAMWSRLQKISDQERHGDGPRRFFPSQDERPPVSEAEGRANLEAAIRKQREAGNEWLADAGERFLSQHAAGSPQALSAGHEVTNRLMNRLGSETRGNGL
ncbi:MAG: hypothetical protein AAGB48_03135 [Planctomycetota bacterium]